MLETHANQHHNPPARLDMRRAPHDDEREDVTDRDGRGIAVLPDSPYGPECNRPVDLIAR